MNKTLLILVVAGLFAGCSSDPVKEPPTEQHKIAAQPVRPATPAPTAESKIATQPAQKPRIEVDPLSDPKNPLARRSIYYDFDSTVIREEDKPLLQAHSVYLAGHPGARVKIEGNCDERGSREYNLALGQRRAESVKATLKLLGARDAQVDTVSWGEEKPSAPGHDESAWAENRRSDIVYEKAR